MLATTTENQARYILDLVKKTHPKIQIRDNLGILRDASEDEFLRWAVSKDQAWAQDIIPKLKVALEERVKLLDSTEDTQATASQKNYGKALERQVLGEVVTDWDNASKPEAWRRIRELKSAQND